MAMTKSQKAEMLDAIKASVSNAEAVTFVQFDGLSVADTTDMRAKLRDEGVSYKVVKKTLLKRTLGELTDVQGEIPSLDGNIAIAWSTEDMTAPARTVYEFAKGHQDNLKIVGGIFEGAYADAVAMNEIATIPSVPVLRGMFVNIINAPIQSFVSVLNQIAESKN
jgi:large subunit ribosomal protein L10